MNVQRTDFYVGLFLVGTIAAVVAAVIATSGWGEDRYDIYVRTDNAQDIAVDTKIYLQGLEVGRVTHVTPRPAPSGHGLEFIIQASLVAKYPDGTLLRLPRGTEAEVITGLLGGSTLNFAVRDTLRGTLAPDDTIDMRRSAPAMEAFGALARDLKGTIEAALVAATGTLDAVKHLADSLTVATGTSRRFIAGIQPATEKAMAGVAVNLDRLRLVLDSANARTGLSFTEVNATIAQSRALLVSMDSLTRSVTAMGGENRPEVRAIMVNMRQLSEQLQYVLEQVGRRPMRLITGVRLPDSLSVEGRDTTRGAGAGAAASSARPGASSDTTRAARAAPGDTARPPRRTPVERSP
ncbi:MAG: MCE family protein [Gemmatimonadetes bacterium]|nr:MCE family protein [Gemmatimonadota bacterium]